MLRLFTGLEIPADIGLELECMRGGVWGARWIDRDAFHITLRFIGDIPEGMARDIAEELDMIDMPAFMLRLKGVGSFGGAKPRSIWAGVEHDATLKRLQAAHERVCQLAGLKPEGRKFAPHVTLARLREPELAGVEQFVAAHSLYESRPFDIDRFVLFSSRPSRGGGPYAVEEAYPLRDYSEAYHLSDFR